MFDAHCDTCGDHVLFGYRRLVNLTNSSDGIRVTFRCYCGAVGSFLTGWDHHPAGRTAAACSP